MPAVRAKAVCVGIGEFGDKGFAALPSAVSTARDIARAFDGTFVDKASVVANPTRSDDVFIALHASARQAKRGSLVVYLAGNAVRRDRELLIAAGDSELALRAGCVPFGDVEDLLVRELVSDALVILNLHESQAERVDAPSARGSTTMITIRHRYDPRTADARILAVGQSVEAALSSPADVLAPFLTEGKLDGDALVRFIRARAKLAADDLVVSGSGTTIVLRDLTRDLAPPAPTPPVVEAPAPQPPPEPEPPPPPASVSEPAAVVALVEAPTPPREEPVEAPIVEPPVEIRNVPAVRETPASTSNVWVMMLVAALVLGAAGYWFFGH